MFTPMHSHHNWRSIVWCRCRCQGFQDYKNIWKTKCVGTTRMSPPWILRRLANVSPFFNSLSNRLRITNYCLRSASPSLLKYTYQKSSQYGQISKPNGCKLAKNHSTGTNFKVDLELMIIHTHTKNQVNISKHSKKNGDK